MQLYLRDIKRSDLIRYFELTHPSKEYHKFNWPYFKQFTEEELEQRIKYLSDRIDNWEIEILEKKKLIVDQENEEWVGEVNRYWKSEETNRMEIWVVIFNENYRWKWIWFNALNLRIDELFTKYDFLVRLWLTTWSWNERMMNLAEKLWFKKEATYRKARIVNWEYFDSVSYWILREEWFNRH
jgi:putative hydrolase of HD superfamily